MVTRADIAKYAGVSVSAVSRAINGRGYVSQAKRQAILHAAHVLGYHAGPLDHYIESNQGGLFCFYSPDTTNPFYLDLFHALSRSAAQQGYAVYLIDAVAPERIRTLPMDGLILGSESVAATVQHALGDSVYCPMVSAAYGLPVVETKRISYVNVDTYRAVELALNHLKSCGHTKIAYASPFENRDGVLPVPRNLAFANIMQPVYRNTFSDYLLITHESPPGSRQGRDFYYEEGIRCAKRFLESGCDATAILCFKRRGKNSPSLVWGMNCPFAVFYNYIY